MNGFVHLHLHSEYSLLDGACRIGEIAKRAKENGQGAVALTDHGVMYGVIAFYRACEKEGIKPIIGCEVYVARGSRFDRISSGDGYADHLVLLCETQKGYDNLSKLVSLGFTEGFYNRPRVDDELLRQYSEGLIALSGCIGGQIPKHLSRGDFPAARAVAMRYREIFGENNFFIEIQDHGIGEEKAVMPSLVELARECGIPLVATNDCHYVRRQDAATQAVLMCIQTNTTVDAGRPAAFATDEFYMKDTNEMEMTFRAYPEAISNTCRIAERCEVKFDFSKTYLPKFPCPNGKTAREYLTSLAYAGYEKRVANGQIAFESHERAEYLSRMEYELSVIVHMGYEDYFLIVQDYVNFARSQDIPVGPGRGSGAGSLVAYVLGITDVDPLQFDLLFERFLNPERVSMPDIDIDFCYNRRDEVIAYVQQKYGRDCVSQIITFGTLAARAAIRDVGRALGMSYGDVDVVARAVPQELGITIADALRFPDLKHLYEESEQIKRLVDTAMAIEGMPRNVSVHAAGVVITDRPVSDYVPLSTSGDTVVTQFDMDTIANLGLLKFDFLALRYLTILHDAERQIRETEPTFDTEKLPLDDADTFKLIASGKTQGLFQLESGGMRQMLMGLAPERLDDIIAAIALYRPGPMDSIPQFIACRHDPAKAVYKTPLLEPILRSTYGCTVYQEQVMQIFREVAGYTFGHADVVRRAMSKKKAAVLLAEREAFVNGAVERGVSEQVASELFSDMESFANYAFNKSHAAAYAVISYRTAYLKQHYPREFFAALLTSVLGNQEKIADYIAECTARGIRVLPPDINESKMVFSVVGRDIRFGLLAIKNVGQRFLSQILDERRRGKFTSLEDFADRMRDGDLNRRMVESLIKAGAFDRLGVYRSQMLAAHERVIDQSLEKGRNNLVGQLDMFSTMPADDSEPVQGFLYPEIPECTVREKLLMEREATGMFFSGDLLDGFRKHLSLLSQEHIAHYAGEEADPADRAPAAVAGIVTSITIKTDKKGARMAFFKLEDRTGEIECIAFARTFAQYTHLIRADAALAVEGNLSVREEERPKLLISHIEELIEDGQFTEQTAAEIAQRRGASAEKSGRDEQNGTPEYAEKSETDAGNPTPVSQGSIKTPVDYAREALVGKEASPKGLSVRSELQASRPALPKRLYLRVPNFDCTLYHKAKNLTEIFDGTYPVVFFDASTRQYDFSHLGVVLATCLLRELRSLLGEENVILK